MTAVWGTGWTRRVAAVVPGSAAELQVALGPSAGSPTEVGAIAQDDSVDVVTGRPLGQRVVVVPDQLRRLSATGRRIVLQHEITHIATAAVTNDTTPRWLVEGFAEYVGNLGSGQSVATAAAELRERVRRSGLPAGLPGDTDFEADATAAAAYQSSWLACRFLADRYGEAALVRFYRAVASSDASVDEAVTAALKSVGLTPVRFLGAWRTYLRDQLRVGTR